MDSESHLEQYIGEMANYFLLPVQYTLNVYYAVHIAMFIIQYVSYKVVQIRNWEPRIMIFIKYYNRFQQTKCYVLPILVNSTFPTVS